MTDFAILTESRYESPKERNEYINNILKEDGLLLAELEKLGHTVHRLSWDRTDVDWSQYRFLVISTTWDYYHRFGEFSGWMSEVSKQTKLINPASLIHWNIDKHYLADLERKGIAIPPTIFIEKGASRSLQELFEASEWNTAILKPVISGAARHTYKLTRENINDYEEVFNDLIQNESLMLQEFMENIYDKGEISLMVMGGEFTHAILKKAKPGDFRVQDDFGGTVHPYDASVGEVSFAESVMKACPELPVYGRVDIFWDNQLNPVVSEVELIEPELWLRFSPKAAARFASLLSQKLH